MIGEAGRSMGRRRRIGTIGRSENMAMRKRSRPALSHLDERGEARMVDVSEKPASVRTAVATARVKTRTEVRDVLLGGGLPKGDALAAARLAGIMAAKRTSDWIPLCHPLRIEWAQVEFAPDARDGIVIRSTVRTTDEETFSAVICGALESTDTRTYFHFDQLPAASVARTAIVHQPLTSVSTVLRDVVD